MRMGPVPTQSGSITVSITPFYCQEKHSETGTDERHDEQGSNSSDPVRQAQTCTVSWDSQWFAGSPEIRIQLPDFHPVSVAAGSGVNSVNCTRIA